MKESEKPTKDQWQKELKENKKLPYAKALQHEADEHLAAIKAGLGHSLMYKEIRPSFLHWLCELDKYMYLHGFRFTKSDHVTFVHILYQVVVMPKLELRMVKTAAKVLVNLLNKRDLISRDDLVLEWKPLYDLYCFLAFKNYEEDGLMLFPDGIQGSVENVIKTCRVYFADDATQEILEEVRPYLCPWDSTFLRGTSCLGLFLPTTLPPHLHKKGFQLWLDEIRFWWLQVQNCPPWETQLVQLFARLSGDNIGYVDWSEYYPEIFTRFLRSLRLRIGVKTDYLVDIGYDPKSFDSQLAAIWFSSMLAPGDAGKPVLARLETLFQALESFYHPSNFGPWTEKLFAFLVRLPSFVCQRVHLERYKKLKWETPIPDHMKLSDKDLEHFVQIMLPSTLNALYSKVYSEWAVGALRALSHLSPNLILEPVLERVFPSLETLIEPHRFMQTMHSLIAVICPLVRNSSRIHILPILNSLLPGLDVNDLPKSLVTFQALSLFAVLVPFVDCSEAIHVVEDLSDEEKELCSATATFEDFTVRLVDRMIEMIESCAWSHGTRGHKGFKGFSPEESILKSGMYSTLRSILNNCSESIYQVIFEKIFRFLSETVLDGRVAAEMTGELCFAVVRTNASVSLPKFLPYIYEKLADLITPETYQEDDVSESVMWYLVIVGQNWAKETKIEDLELTWHVASSEERTFVSELIQSILLPELQTLEKAEQMSNEETLKSLTIIRSCLNGASPLLPILPGPFISLIPDSLQVDPNPFTYTIDCLDDHPQVTLKGENVRKVVYGSIHKLLETLLISREDDTKSLKAITTILMLLLFHRGTYRQKFDGQNKGFQMAKKMLMDSVKGKRSHVKGTLVEMSFLHHQKRLLERSGYHFTEVHLSAIRDLVKLATSHYSEVRKDAQHLLDSCFVSFPYSYRLVLDEILEFLKPLPNISHEQFKGALYILLGGKKRSLCARNDWPALLKMWPAVIGAQHSEKPSIVSLLDVLHNSIVEGLESFEIRSEVSDSAIKAAQALWQSKNIPPSLPVPPEASIQAAQALLKDRNDQTESAYISLLEKLVGLAQDPNLHWRYVDMAHAFLTLMVRPDFFFPKTAVQVLVSMLVHDSLKTRKMGVGSISAFLKLLKRPSKKIPLDFKMAMRGGGDSVAALGPEGPWPLKWGLRPDNHFLQYDPGNSETAADDVTYVDKTHWGFYCWPKKMTVSAPTSQQPKDIIVSSKEGLKECEVPIWNALSDKSFIAKLCDFLSLEEKKGEDTFNTTHFLFFKGVFQNYGDTFLDKFTDRIEEFAKDEKENKQRFVAEFFAGLVQGSKRWPHAKLVKAQNWLVEKVLKPAMGVINAENMKDWGTALATCFDSRDPRRVQWLIDFLFDLVLKWSHETSFQAATRLYFLQGGINQQEWRVLHLWQRLLKHLEGKLEESYQNLRERYGSVLSTIFWFSLPGISTTTTDKPPDREPFLDKILTEKLPVLFQFVEASADENGHNGNNGSALTRRQRTLNEAEKKDYDAAILVLKTLLSYMHTHWAHSYYSLPTTLLKFLPLLCYYENDNSDPELKRETHLQLLLMGKALLRRETVKDVLIAVHQVSESCWWKAKVSLLHFIQTIIFSNLFLLDEEMRLKINEFLIEMLKDAQIEVRKAASETLSGFMHFNFMKIDNALIEKFRGLTLNSNVNIRHAGILGLSAIIQSCPYTVPTFLPDVLMIVSRHANGPQPISSTCRKILSDFKRTHQDNWHEHKQQFTDDQLSVLTDLLLSPNYYV